MNRKKGTQKQQKQLAAEKTYDLIVIGGGGGARLAAQAASQGKKVALIEKELLGGTCLNRGCIPSKMIIHPANVMNTIREAKKFGIKADLKGIDFTSLLKYVNKTTDNDAAESERAWQNKKNVDYYKGQARFITNTTLEITPEQNKAAETKTSKKTNTKTNKAAKKLIVAKKIVIAAGARPVTVPIKGLEGTPYWTSREALRQRKQPKRLIVIGGGYIGCELGHAYGAFGTDVHVIQRGNLLLAREDEEVAQAFTDQFTKRYTVHFNYDTTKVEYKYNKKQFTLTLKDLGSGKEKKLTADALLVAVGVKPNSDLLGLENTTIKTNARGFIETNKFLETTAKGVYAIGDISGNFLFRHAVNFEALYLERNIFAAKPKQIMYPPMPHAVFSAPEVGSVGKTEQELKEQKIPYISAVHYYKNSAMGMARRSEHEFVKVLAHKKTRKLLGVHILGEEASTMVHQFIYAMTNTATVDELDDMIYIHPALPEVARNAIRKAKELLGAQKE